MYSAALQTTPNKHPEKPTFREDLWLVHQYVPSKTYASVPRRSNTVLKAKGGQIWLIDLTKISLLFIHSMLLTDENKWLALHKLIKIMMKYKERVFFFRIAEIYFWY